MNGFQAATWIADRIAAEVDTEDGYAAECIAREVAGECAAGDQSSCTCASCKHYVTANQS